VTAHRGLDARDALGFRQGAVNVLPDENCSVSSLHKQLRKRAGPRNGSSASAGPCSGGPAKGDGHMGWIEDTCISAKQPGERWPFWRKSWTKSRDPWEWPAKSADFDRHAGQTCADLEARRLAGHATSKGTTTALDVLWGGALGDHVGRIPEVGHYVEG